MMRFDGTLYNKPYSFKYPKAGDKNSIVELWLYDIASGEIYYKMAVPFCGGVNLSQEVFHMLTFVGTSTINAYNDKLYLISQGMMTVSDLMKQKNN